MLKHFTDQRSGRLLALLFGLMIAVLLVLGFFQYRWISEAGDAAERQLRENLDASAAGFASDFEDQLRQVGSAFRQPRSSEASDRMIAERYRRDYETWSAVSSFPQLIQDAFLAKPGPDGDINLLRFNPENPQLDPVDWPADLAGMKRLFAHEGSNPGQRFAAAVPAMVVPLFPPLPPGRVGLRGQRGRDPFTAGLPPFREARQGPPPRGASERAPGPAPDNWSDWLIFRFNREVFQDNFLRQLVSHHFPQGNDAIYDVMIVETGTKKVVYSSAGNLTPQDFLVPDVRLPLPEAALDRLPFGPRAGGALQPGNPTGGGWQLLVRHRMGSLHMAAGQLRRRNTIVGIGILGVLAAGLLATWVASNRVRKLGQMQIELAAGISHELRTPLAAIRSAGYNMVAGHVAKPEDIVKYGRLFQDQGERLSSTVEQALLFAQTHSGKNTYSLQPCDPVEIAEQVISSCKVLEGAANRLAVRSASDVPLAITDPTALRHCLHNLVVNALKYAGVDGEITVEIQRAKRKGNSEIEIAVTDRGPGIDARDLPHLFEPFFRGRNSTNMEGNGLGLYLVRRTIESTRGRITVASSAGNGARFTLYVPAVPEAMVER